MRMPRVTIARILTRRIKPYKQMIVENRKLTYSNSLRLELVGHEGGREVRFKEKLKKRLRGAKIMS